MKLLKNEKGVEKALLFQKKIICFLIVGLLLINSVVAVTEEDVKVLPDERFKYWLMVKVPEWFSTTFEFNKEKLMEKRLELMEKRRIEFEKLAEKFENLSEEHKARYEVWLIKTEERRARLQEKIGRGFSKVSEEKRLEAIARFEEHKKKFEEMKENLPSSTQRIQITIDNMEIKISELSEDIILPPFLEGICGDKGAELGEIEITFSAEKDCIDRNGVYYDGETTCAPRGKSLLTVCRAGCELPDGTIDKLIINAKFRLPVCLCDSDSQCPEGTSCISEASGKTLDQSVCYKPKE